MRLFLLLILLLPITSQAFSWHDLWQRRDQQAAKALQTGHPQEAAELFTSSSWKASAYYRSGQYEKAEKEFGEETTAEAYYNLGNTLAQQGQLKEGIAAYDKALKQTPNMADATRNKALLEKLLEEQEKQKSQDQSSSDNKQSNEQKNKPSEQQQAEKKPEQQNNKDDTNQDQQKIPMTEQQQANAQWLSSIPDDPGGLLKQKFRRDHERYQTEGF